MTRDWQEWYRSYDDPASSLSRRLDAVREQLRARLLAVAGSVRIVSLCAGDGRDTLPVVAETGVDASVLLVELDPGLASAARDSARTLGLPAVEVRTANAGTTTSYDGAEPADVLMACGVFGNITDEDIATAIGTFPSFLVSGGHVIWTRGHHVPQDPTAYDGDPSRAGAPAVRRRGLRGGHVRRRTRWASGSACTGGPGATGTLTPGVRMFTFV